MKQWIPLGLAVATIACVSGNAMATIGWGGNVWPNHGYNLVPTGDQNVYAQVWKGGVTDAGGQGAGILAELRYWTDADGGPYVVPMSYNTDIGSNDEYFGTIPQAHISGSSWVEVHVVFTDETDGTYWTDTLDQNGNPPPQRYNVVNVLPNDVSVTFTLCMSGSPTDGAPCVIGGAPEIGSWGTGVTMTQVTGDLYEVTVVFAAGGNPSFEYKYKKDACNTWEGTSNRATTLPTDGTTAVSLPLDSWEFLPLGCDAGEVLAEHKEVCFELCMRDVDYTGLPCVIGSGNELGNWGTGVSMTALGYDLFRVCVVYVAGTPVPINAEYKYKKDDCQNWESSPNRTFTIDNTSPASQTFQNTWEDAVRDCTPPVPTQPASWGRIKSQYR